jgi:hypothetical protein
MEVNKPFNICVKCTNADLLYYIKEKLVLGSEILPGLEFVSFIENSTAEVEIKEEPKPTQTPLINHNYKPTYQKPTPNYNGGWVDMDNKSAVQDMFDSLRF